MLKGEGVHVSQLNQPIKEILSATSSMLSQFLKEIGPRAFRILDLRKSILCASYTAQVKNTWQTSPGTDPDIREI